MDKINPIENPATKTLSEKAEKLLKQINLLHRIEQQKTEELKALIERDNAASAEPDEAKGINPEEGHNSRLKLETETENLRKKSEKEAKHLYMQLNQNEESYRAELRRLENVFKNSWRWRIGNFIVNCLTLCVNFVKIPVRFILQLIKKERWAHSGSTEKKSNPFQAVQKRNSANEDRNFLSGAVNLPSQKLLPVERNGNKPVIAAIFDEFTSVCFHPESTMVTFRPDNWKETIENKTPEVLFIESAWHGNGNSWQYKIAKYNNDTGEELIKLIDWAKEKKIPTVFWNKEDPPNFNRFIDKAILFDYIFTSDANCITDYRKKAGHDRIFSLPFAAQPAIHNPVSEDERTNNVCFAGTYHSDEYYERQGDMGIILKPALDFGLHIWDRHFGASGTDAERFRFPDIYQPCIKGRLNYDEMVKAYHRYKVFLNVNSVKESPTMFSRRVFELLACGTPVISTYSKGIEALLGDTVFITESEKDTKDHLDVLLNDKLAWMKASVKGIRKVMEFHTYDIRLKEILDKAGVKCELKSLPGISLLIHLKEGEEALVIDTIHSQTYKPAGIILFSEREITEEYINQIRTGVNYIPVRNIVFGQRDMAKQLIEMSSGEYYAIWNLHDFYGPDYLKDYALSVKYSENSFIGKNNYYVYEGSILREINPGNCFKYSLSVPLGTLMMKRDQIAAFDPLRLIKPDALFESFAPDILSLDPLNYIKNNSDIDFLTHSKELCMSVCI